MHVVLRPSVVTPLWRAAHVNAAHVTPQLLRSKGLKDATCMGWFGDDWDCSVGSPPEAIDHVSSSVPIGYTV